MPNFQIRSHVSQAILFQGEYMDFKSCLEDAIQKHICLDYADFRHTDLAGINMDDICLHGADFTGGNLTGANLSESKLEACVFSRTSLYNTCFAYAVLSNCCFKHAHFGATDISGTHVSRCHFAGISFQSLNFVHAKSIRGCSVEVTATTSLQFNTAPVVISGLSGKTISIYDDAIRIGSQSLDLKSFLQSIRHYIPDDPNTKRSHLIE